MTSSFSAGAGVSRGVGYPLGLELFDEIDHFVRDSGKLVDRFDYGKDWNDLQNWLNANKNPAIAQAYRSKNIEHLFTALDFVSLLRSEALLDTIRAQRGSQGRSVTSARFEVFDREVGDYEKYRRILIWALEHYFAWRHSGDLERSKEKTWDTLRALADRLRPGDVAITFNYDATLERVLLDAGKWSLGDGYGFELVFQKSRHDESRITFPKSPILILHLHGATGWYHRPMFAPGYEPAGSGAVSPEVFGAASMDTNISLDPQFLEGLGILNVDACLPELAPVANERHVVLHPSFLKDYETDESGSHALPELWKVAAQKLREAEHTYIIGYSLPRADVAVLTLTNLRRGTTTVVNRSGSVTMRLGELLGAANMFKALTLEDWLSSSDPHS